jgi:drug/metabolite transporter (DMT)-like permease
VSNSPTKIIEVASLRGMAMGIAAYTLFSFHDVFVKALVYTMPAAQILFMRSIVIIALCFAFDRRHLVRDLLQSDNRLLILGRGLLTLAAWVMYYTAARDLQLAELTTLYYFAPVLTTILAVIFLKEQVTLARVGAASIGFFGVIVAANPAGFALSLPVVLVLMAALSWAIAMILMRKISKKDRAIVQVFAQNLIHAFAMGLFSLPFWQGMTALEICLCIGPGLSGAWGSFCSSKQPRSYRPASSARSNMAPSSGPSSSATYSSARSRASRSTPAPSSSFSQASCWPGRNTAAGKSCCGASVETSRR